MGQTTEKFLAHHASINMLDGECNDIHPLAFMAGGQVNPNILNHGEAMATVDKEQFQTSMDEEMGKCFDNEIYEIVKRSSVPELKSILRAVWSHRRKTTPDGTIYRHRSRICVDGSTQKEGIDYNETYSPVVIWSTLRKFFCTWKSLRMVIKKNGLCASISTS